jgi:hypothetical protein
MAGKAAGIHGQFRQQVIPGIFVEGTHRNLAAGVLVE